MSHHSPGRMRGFPEGGRGPEADRPGWGCHHGSFRPAEAAPGDKHRARQSGADDFCPTSVKTGTGGRMTTPKGTYRKRRKTSLGGIQTDSGMVQRRAAYHGLRLHLALSGAAGKLVEGMERGAPRGGHARSSAGLDRRGKEDPTSYGITEDAENRTRCPRLKRAIQSHRPGR